MEGFVAGMITLALVLTIFGVGLVVGTDVALHELRKSGCACAIPEAL